MSMIETNIRQIEEEIRPSNARLIVVSKYRPLEEIQQAYDCGQRAFAENRVQSLLERRESLPSDCEWHLIGSLQTNKVKYISEFITLIHSVDSLKLAQEIDKQAQKQGRCIDVLLQTRVAQEDSKQGVPPDEFPDFVSALLKDPLPGIRIRGIMGMASFVEDTQQIHQEFSEIETLFNETKHRFFSNDALFSELSIGMSGDYRLALQHGATLVRIGSAIFQ